MREKKIFEKMIYHRNKCLATQSRMVGPVRLLEAIRTRKVADGTMDDDDWSVTRLSLDYEEW